MRCPQLGFAEDCPTSPSGVFMSVVVEYFKIIDLLALLALAVLAFAALRRNGSVWLFVSGVLIVIWGAMRILGWP
jgi:hypothetical protein